MKASELIKYLNEKMIDGKDFEIVIDKDFAAFTIEFNEIYLKEIENEN